LIAIEKVGKLGIAIKDIFRLSYSSFSLFLIYDLSSGSLLE
jgi:hypothetical protein